jgi:hypothetical protein
MPADDTQGSSFLATLGFAVKSLWDSPFAVPGNGKLPKRSVSEVSHARERHCNASLVRRGHHFRIAD